MECSPTTSLGWVLISCLIGLYPACTVAQVATPSFDVIRIGVEHGLSHRMVNDVLEDHEGYMWFATRDGLNRFDGHRFVVYTHVPGDSLSLPDSKVTRLFETADGTLWIGSDAGLIRFDRSDETFRRVPFQSGAEQMPYEPINDIVETPDGSLWLVTWTPRIFRLLPGAAEFELLEVSVQGKKAGYTPNAKMGVDHEGRIVIYCDMAANGSKLLGRLNTKTGECTPDGMLPGIGTLGAIGFASDGSTIVSSSSAATTNPATLRVIRWNGQLSWSATLEGWIVTDLVVDERDQIWLATSSGVYLLDKTGGVISRFTRSQVDNKSLSADRTNAVVRTRDGSVWVATDDGLTVFVPAKAPFKAIQHRPGDPASLGDPRVNAILETLDGSLWVGTSKGLYKRPAGKKSFESIVIPDPQRAHSGRQERIWSMIEVSPGIIWFGTAAAGLYQLNIGSHEIRHVDAVQRLIAARNGVDLSPFDGTSIPFMGWDQRGNLWMTARRAIIRMDSTEALAFVAAGVGVSPQASGLVNFIRQDVRGDYWAASDMGLWALDVGTGATRGIGQTGSWGAGLSYGSVWSLVESPLTPHALWIGTIGGGLNRYDVHTGRFTWYTMTDGLPSNGIYGMLVDDHGLIWMSTTNGLARFNPVTGFVERFTRQDGLHEDDFDLMAYHKGVVSGKMWFGGPTGLTEFHPDSVAHVRSDFRVNISGVTVLDGSYPGIVGDGDTLRLAHTQNSLGFRFSAPDLLHPKNVSYRFRMEGYDDNWRTNEATSPEVAYTQLPPGRYTFEVQAAGQELLNSAQTTRLFVWITPAFWQTGWFMFGCLFLALGAFGSAIWSVQSRRGRRAMEVACREVELKRMLAEREELERGRLAREIHDGPLQTLYSVKHRLEEASSEALSVSRRDVNDLASELRAICEHLRPALVRNLGLEGALRSRVRTLSRTYPALTVSLTFDSRCSDLEEATGHACYRIVQEALSNIIQHSGASHAGIELSRNRSACRLLITDNGAGFDLPSDWLELVRGSHFGLVGMRERAEMQGGVCRIDSASGKGTRIEVDFPMTNLD